MEREVLLFFLLVYKTMKKFQENTFTADALYTLGTYKNPSFQIMLNQPPNLISKPRARK